MLRVPQLIELRLVVSGTVNLAHPDNSQACRSKVVAQQTRDGVHDPSFFSVQTGLPREVAESLTRATQPGLESLRHVGCYPVKQTVVW